MIQVTSYRYLGSIVTEDGRSEVEIKTRIAMAKKAFWKMKEVTRGQVNLTARKRILNCYIFSVLKYGCESWTLDKSLQKKITAFEHWCYRRMLKKVSWKDKVKNTEVLARMAEKEPQFYKNIARQKMAYAGHALRGSSGLNALLIMEDKISGVKARGRPRRAWTDDLKDWTQLRNYSEFKRTAEDRTIWNALARQPST